jgi:hypothetical protein
MTAPDDIQPLLVRPRKAWRILDCGNTRGYELLAKRELDSFVDGRARWITMDSIRRYIERRLAQSGVSSAVPLSRPLVAPELRKQTRRRPPGAKRANAAHPRNGAHTGVVS